MTTFYGKSDNLLTHVPVKLFKRGSADTELDRKFQIVTILTQY